ncbi:DUF6177 family protein [Actinocorallia populi]|uniref:DUF6177 family protein n=1 Tax=Actinocorallia populi TaxID=2079200 RepID=UPI000D094458|nr:DUF6177 family protein [Actinocorallia populi]
MSVSDVLTAKASVLLQDRAVVPLLGWMAPEGRALQVVTPPTSRLTLPLSLALMGADDRWVVADGTVFYDGLTGHYLRWDGECFSPDPQAPGHAPGFTARSETAVGGQLFLTMESRVPQGEPLAGALAQVCQAVLGYPPTGWGRTEPAGMRWDRARFTEELGSRPGRAVVVCSAGMVASTSVMPLPDGSHLEQSTVVIGFADPSTVPVPQMSGIVAKLPGVTAASAQVRFGRPDLTVEPRWTGAPVPIQL